MERNKGNQLQTFLNDFTVIDTEATGRGYDYREITEISAVRYRKGQPVASYSSLIKPQSLILPYVIGLTGITDEMVAQAPKLEDVIEEFIRFIDKDVIVGHDVSYDMNLIYDGYEAKTGKSFNNDYVDTLQLSRIINLDAPNHKLETLCQYYNIDRIQGHRALDDCRQTGSLYLKMSNKIKNTEGDSNERI